MNTVVREFFSRFVPVSDAEWTTLQPLLRERSLRAGEVLSREGDVCRQLAFVDTGILRYFITRDGAEFTGTFFFEGSVAVDYGSFISQTPARQWIGAIEASTVWLLSHEAVQRLYASSATWERRGRLIAEFVLVHAQRRAASLALDEADVRYLALLAERPKVIERIPLYLIASYLGITPEALSRVRRRLGMT
jgi:CRP-like cAMP-binding protein